eukprot:3941968-Rhodomonas_salina.1
MDPSAVDAGERIGILVQISPLSATHAGCSVLRTSAAARSQKFKAGDVVLKVDGVEVAAYLSSYAVAMQSPVLHMASGAMPSLQSLRTGMAPVLRSPEPISGTDSVQTQVKSMKAAHLPKLLETNWYRATRVPC